MLGPWHPAIAECRTSQVVRPQLAAYNRSSRFNVFYSGLLNKAFALAGVLLALVASLPSVVCCCNISWGPGGFLGADIRCKDDCDAMTSEASCCCCVEHATQQVDDSPTIPRWSSTSGNCQFSFVAPPPMFVSDAAPIEATVDHLPYGAWTQAVDDINRLALDYVDMRCDHTLTPSALCALLQTWQT